MILLVAVVGLVAGVAQEGHVLSEGAAELALEFSPLEPVPADPTNAYSESEHAARLGQALFYDGRFSSTGEVSCATCHDPARSFTDGRKLARGVANLPRHSMTLWNVAYNRWFFWDGRADTLWSQALGPLEDAREHRSSRLEVAHLIASDAGYVRAWRETFGQVLEPLDLRRFPAAGRPVARQPEHPHSRAWDSMEAPDQELVNRLFVNVGKALAAYERKLVSGAAPFDTFVAGLRDGDPDKLAALSSSAQRGFEVFQGKGRCHFCHDGPNFTDLEFHTNRVPTGEGVDLGRSIGVRKLLGDPFNSLSVYADDGGKSGRRKVGSLRPDEHPVREFKTPTLRNVARTAPYMHEGQLATLEEVIEFYSELDGAVPLKPADERLVLPLHLTEEEKADLLAFLHSLTDESLDASLVGPPATPYLAD